MEAFSDIQEDIRSKIVKAKSNFKKCPKDRLTYAYVETRLESLEQHWQLFHTTHVKIISEIKKSELFSSNYHKNCVYDEVEELYILFKSDLKEFLNNSNISSDAQTNIGASSKKEVVSNFKLPEVKIPMFSGKYLEWQTFRDLFVGLIHNNKRLDDAQKLYYLKGYLTGDAEQLLRNVNVTSDNYKASWDKLQSMYNNKRFIAKGILKRLFNQRPLTSESATEIKRLISTTSECLGSLKNLGIDVASWDILIIHIVSAKLDKETKKAWEFKVASDPTDDLPTFTQFSDFLTSRFRGLENLDDKVDRKPKTTQSLHVIKEKVNVCCEYCSEDHKITSCPKFSKESCDSRRNFVQDKGLCFICLNSNHSARYCKNTVRCQVCKRRHHSWLHPTDGSGSVGKGSINDARKESPSNATEGKEVATPAEESSNQVVSCLSTGNRKRTILLTTALINAESKNGTYRVVRALLDQESQGSFITESMVQYLGLKKIPFKNTVLGVGGEKSATATALVIFKIRSRVNPTFELKINAYVLKSVTAMLPASSVTRVEWEDFGEKDLADPEYFRPNKIDVLLGAEVYSQVIQGGVKKTQSGSLLAQETTLGWILSGSCEVDNNSNIYSHNITVTPASGVQDDELLKKFWELEAEPRCAVKILNKEETECEKLFAATTSRDESGRYIVRLPFRDCDRSCKDGDSRLISERRFKSLEYKLSKNDKLRKDYSGVMQEYIDLNHMVKVPKNEKTEGLYLPHHAVIREDKKTTKVRVVFDASCKGKNGVSLNDNLMVGPTLQAELRHTIMRWRRHPICISADIIKMYRQIQLERELEEYELVTVTFGTASAPFLAVRTLHQVAYDEGEDHPVVSKIILNDFYMDDLMTGAETVEEGYKIYEEIKEILAKGGFQLQKWITNSEELLQKIKEGKRTKGEEVKIERDNITKILGLTWDPRADVFQYTVELPPQTGPVSKRKIISDIARLFDPLGWLAPSIILAKMLIQKLWLAGVSWDEEVPAILLKEWTNYRKDLPLLMQIKIPRWCNTKSNSATVELHGFSDASKLAYAAVVYIRVVDVEGVVRVALVASKTKVSPIKQVSIPRLELCAAVLLSKLMADVSKALEINGVDLHAWTDSEVVLAWLNSHPSRWKTFVGNRVAEILNTLDTQHWSYVASKENPADCASRGVAPSDLVTFSSWFNGPEFLRQSAVQYKKPKHLVTKLEEVKSHTTMFEVTFWNRFSSLSRLVRVVAYCRRFLINSRKQNRSRRGLELQPLTKQELDEALEIGIKNCQAEGFTKELEDLKNKKELKNGILKPLNVFLDPKGIIRVGGRLEMSQLDYQRVHPILIPKESFLTPLLIADAHEKTLHGGPQLMITYLRTKYWIIGVKLLTKRYVRGCVRCIRYAAKVRTQLMGQLPTSRVTPNKPFLSSGVDYAGPINIRVSKGRGNKSYKGYIALFVCMATRAVHLEAVSDLSTQGFLTAFRRFVARIGRCAELHSDNGTNFVGAARELLHLFNQEKSACNPDLAEELANNGTEWHFIPPHSPNFGGLWEAGIKSTKYHLKRVIGNSTLTFEEIITVLAQIEACLNSRPLSYTEDQDKLTILTPGHFLVGEPLVMVPDYNYEKSNINTLKRWQLNQRMMQDFWRRWSHDYLHQFLQRHKWAHKNPEPSVGNVVLVMEDDMPPGKWLLGRVERKHPGPDGITRVVTLRTQNSVVKRPTSKLCLLPVTD